MSLANLDTMRGLLANLPEATKATLKAHVGPAFERGWVPNPGPQTEAYNSPADLLLYGGAAGGGKTDLLLGLATQRHHRSLIFRRTYKNLAGIEQRLVEILGGRNGYNGQAMSWTDGERLLEMGALEKPGAEQDWQGRPHDLIGFDEGAQLSEVRVRTVMGWLRTTKPGQRTRVVIASNPPLVAEGEWLVQWFAPWLDPAFDGLGGPATPGVLRWAVMVDDATVWVAGPEALVLTDRARKEFRPATADEVGEADRAERTDVYRPKSRTFIPAKLADNTGFTAEAKAQYMAELMAMPEAMRVRLIQGDFLAARADQDWQVIPTDWIEQAMARWAPPTGNMTCIGVDVAQGGADNTVLAPLYGEVFDRPVVVKGVDTKDGYAIAALVVRHRRGKAAVAMDMTGGWGGGAKVALDGQGITVTPCVASAASGGRTQPDERLGFRNERAEMWWRFREALDPTRGATLALPPSMRLKVELQSPTYKAVGDKITIESKDEVRVRVGRSTDEADAHIMAWFKRHVGVAQLAMGKNGWGNTAGSPDPFQWQPGGGQVPGQREWAQGGHQGSSDPFNWR